jgi:hypothetical protein
VVLMIWLLRIMLQGMMCLRRRSWKIPLRVPKLPTTAMMFVCVDGGGMIPPIVGFTGVTLTVELWDRRSNRKRDGMKVPLGDGTTMTVTTVFCRPRTQVGMMNATIPAGVLPAIANVIAVATQIIT